MVKAVMARLRRKLANRRRKRFLTSYRAVTSNIQIALQAQATAETAQYVSRAMRNVQSVSSWRAVHDIAITHVSLADGLWLEFGVFSGTTINYIAKDRDWTVDGFDSFEGLPEDWRDGYAKSAFQREAPPEVAQNVQLHIGLFEDTLPDYVAAPARAGKPVAYLHIDCDLYSSTKTVLGALAGNITKGTVIVFDEYFNYDGWEHGEFKAFQEFVAEQGLSYTYLTYNHEHQQVAVLVT